MTKIEKFRDACVEATKVFAKINNKDYKEIIANLEYCIGSYDHDKNPSGLIIPIIIPFD